MNLWLITMDMGLCCVWCVPPLESASPYPTTCTVTSPRTPISNTTTITIPHHTREVMLTTLPQSGQNVSLSIGPALGLPVAPPLGRGIIIITVRDWADKPPPPPPKKKKPKNHRERGKLPHATPQTPRLITKCNAWSLIHTLLIT